MERRVKLVLVSGAGKTTLAIPLARALDYALITKDILKESLYDTLGPSAGNGSPGDVAFSRKIGGAAMEALWALAAKQNHAVLEANFRPYSDYERAKVSALIAAGARVVEVYCRCPAQEAARRFAARAAAPGHHPAHFAVGVSVESLKEFDKPFALSPVIEADTTQAVDVAAIAAQVRALLD